MESVTRLRFRPYDWFATEETGPEGNPCEVVYCFAKDANGEDSCLRFDGFQPFCFFELPRFIDGSIVRWSRAIVETITEELRCSRALNKGGVYLGPVRTLYVQRENLYFCNPRIDEQGNVTFAKNPMMITYFESTTALRTTASLLDQKSFHVKKLGNVEMRGRNHEPHEIGTIRKFLTQLNLKYCQWFEVDVESLGKGEGWSKKALDYIARIDTVRPLSEEEEKTMPMVPVRVLGLDIEQYSKIHNKMPDPTMTSDVVYMISSNFHVEGQPETRRRTLITCLPISDLIPDGTQKVLVRCENEMEVLQKFQDEIEHCDPDIMAGYNSMSYDWPVMDMRLQRKRKDWRNLSKMKHEQPRALITRKWKSSAYGHMNLMYPGGHGVIDIDLLPLVKRDYKMPKYDLNSVGMKFLKRGKHDMPAKEMFRIYKETMDVKRKLAAKPDDEELQQRMKQKMDEVRDIGEYCLRDTDLVLDLHEKLKVWIASMEFASISGVSITDLYTRGQQARVLSLLYDAATKQGFVLDKKSIPKMPYEGGFVGTPIKGKHKDVYCFDFNSLYPSIIMDQNICYTTYVPPERTDVPDELCNIIEWDQTVEEEVLVSRRSKAGSSDENDADVEFDNDDSDSDTDDEDDEEEVKPKTEKRTRVIHHRYRFIKAQYRKGLLPEIVRKLVNDRKQVRKEIAVIEKEEFLRGTTPEEQEEWEYWDKRSRDMTLTKPERVEGLCKAGAIWKKGIALGSNSDSQIQKAILEERQKSIKVTANSVYGFLGAQEMGRRPFIQASMSVTAFGRQAIQRVNRYLEEKYGAIIVYNDTDSAMAKFPNHQLTPEEIEDFGRAIAKELSDLFGPDLNLDHEKCAASMLCIKKKMYVMMTYGIDGKPKMEYDDWLVKGLMPARRDGNPWAVELYKDVLKDIMYNRSIDVAAETIENACLSMLRHEVPWKKLVAIKQLGANYKSPSYPMKIFADELRRKGIDVQPGERLEYLISDIGREDKQGYKMVLPQQYLESLGTDNPIRLDFAHYVEKTIMNRMKILLECGYIDELQANPKKYEVRRMTGKKLETRLTVDYVKTLLKIAKAKKLVLTQLKELPRFGPELVVWNDI